MVLGVIDYIEKERMRMSNKRMKFVIVIMCLLGMFAISGCQLVNETGELDIDALEQVLQEELEAELNSELAEDIMDASQQMEEISEELLNAETGSAEEQTTEEAEQLTEDELYEQWHRLVGYWNTSEGQFAVPDMADSHSAVFCYGIWETEFATDYGRVTQLTASGDEELTAVVVWDGGEPEEQSIVIDYSGLEKDGSIFIKIGQQDWMRYTSGGATAEEALQAYMEDAHGTVSESEDSLWPDCEFTRQLTKPYLAIESVQLESDRINIIFADSVTHEELIEYATFLQEEEGFNIDVYVDPRSVDGLPRYSFTAQNANGYYADLYSGPNDNSLCIRK